MKGNISLINKIIFIINIILLIVCFLAYRYIFQVETTKKIYAEESVKFVEGNKNPVFKVKQVTIYSSAYVNDKSEGQLTNLDVSQFTDMQIMIDNKSKSQELTAENTVSQLFITNIKVETDSMTGDKVFNYKNPLNFGKYTDLENYRDDGIIFNIINSNEKNREANYDENVFYTDCSNPISLAYANKNIITNGQVNADNASITFDGSILADAGIDIKSLNTTISFTIHILNNYNEEFVCDMKIKNDLTNDAGISSGYLMNIIKGN